MATILHERRRMPEAPAKLMSAPPLDTASASLAASAEKSVAVIIAAWRAADTIGRAVSSALAQPEAAEVIVVDDASGDNGATLDAAKAADDGSGRLILVALKVNGGPAQARNAAINSSKSPWICILNSDDYMEPGRLGSLLAAAGDGHDFVADDMIQVWASSPRSAGRPLWFKTGEPRVMDISFAYFINGNRPVPSRSRGELGFLKPMMSRAFLDRQGLRYDEGMRLGEDYDLYARALARGARFRLIPASGYVSFILPNGLSSNHSRKDLVALYEADDRLLATPGLTPAEKTLLRRHRFTTKERIAWIDFMDRLKSKRLAAAATLVLGDPRLTPAILEGLGNVVRKRLPSARKTKGAA